MTIYIYIYKDSIAASEVGRNKVYIYKYYNIACI